MVKKSFIIPTQVAVDNVIVGVFDGFLNSYDRRCEGMVPKQSYCPK